jgi:tetratricopeptide (TPR) repeat protein
MRKNYFKVLHPIFFVLVISFGTAISSTLAQTEPPSSPLEITEPDPLLPQSAIKRPLSPLERDTLEQALDELDRQATAQIEAGNPDGAFTIWYRELRLRRALGRLEEVRALGRVGEIAWQKNRKLDGQIIAKRLETIQQEAETEKQLNGELLNAFAVAYQQLRVTDRSIPIYQKILDSARQAGDRQTEDQTLKIIAESYLSSFNYSQAAATYEELLVKARAESDSFNELVYLQKLIYIYNQSLQPENALKAKQQLAENYLKSDRQDKLASLKISIADDYVALKEPEKASQTYQDAFTLAWSLQQLATASDALEKLGNIYVTYDNLEYALQIYQELLKVQGQSYNYFGLMTTYDRIGEIYLSQKNDRQALAAFQKGLEIAKSLKYNEEYFQTKIEKINQKFRSSVVQ